MQKTRSIPMSLWHEDWFNALSSQGKMQFLYLLTNPGTTISGIYAHSTVRMVFYSGFTEDDIAAGFAELESAGLAAYCQGYVILPTFPDLTSWKTASKVKLGIINDLQGVPAEVLAEAKRLGYRFPMELVGEVVVARRIRQQLSGSRRIAVLSKTKGACAVCGKTGKVNGVEAHHIVPVLNGGTNALSNLIGLCKVCHTAVHAGFETIPAKYLMA